jgi:O-antigen biosynthesis protein
MGRLGGVVLDIGCGRGEWAPQLRAAGAERLIGLEPSGDASAARRVYDEVIELGIEDAELPTANVIIVADVLEHLVDPWSTLVRLREQSGSNCRLYISVPNAQWYKGWSALAAGRVPYDDNGGFWDIGHLRWFTTDSLVSSLDSAGWRTQRVDHVTGTGARGRLNRASGLRLGRWLAPQVQVSAIA